jgi:hypothetical protein
MSLRYLLALVLVTALVPSLAPAGVPTPAAAASRPARAAGGDPPDPAPAERYIGPMALSLMPLALVAASMLDKGGDDTTLALTGAISFAVSGVFVHAANRQSFARTSSSLLLRVGLPVMGTAIGLSQIHDCICERKELPWPLIGLFTGVAIASAADIALAAKPGPYVKPSPSRLGPALGARPGGLSIGLAGSF